MKNSLRLLLLGALLAPASLFAAAFEGKINFKMSSGRDKPQEIHYRIKGDKLRIEMPGQKETGGVIMDMKKGEMIMLMSSEKMYMTMPLGDSQGQSKAKGDAEDVKLEKTGETEKILGHTATKYVSTDKKGNVTDLWLAEGLGSFMAMSNDSPMSRKRSSGPDKSWERALAGKELFPLRVIGKDKAGKETFRMETTALEKLSLPDSDFAPPADYSKFDMGGMGGMMKGLLPGFGR